MLIIASVILVVGIGGAKIVIGGVEFAGMALATYIGIILNLIIPQSKTLESTEKASTAKKQVATSKQK